MKKELIYIIVIVYIVIQAIRVIIKYINAERISKDTLICYTGTMGSGKTYLAVKTALNEYNGLKRRYKKANNMFYGFIYKRLYPDANIEPHLFSNIPILTKINLFNRKKDIYCEVLTAEQITMKKRIPPNSVVVIDEVSLTMNQYEYNNPLVMEQTSTLMRFSRQWEIKRIIMTDQSLSIVKPVRQRIAIAYMLTDFGRFGRLPFYKVTTVPLLMVDDQSTNISDDLDKYFFGVLPYVWWQRIFRSKRYDTKCFSPIYYEGWETEPPARYTDLKTRYVIDVTTTTKDENKYKSNKKEYRDEYMRGLKDIS